MYKELEYLKEARRAVIKRDIDAVQRTVNHLYNNYINNYEELRQKIQRPSLLNWFRKRRMGRLSTKLDYLLQVSIGLEFQQNPRRQNKRWN